MSELKLIRIFVEKKFLLPLRIVLLLVAMPFLFDAYEVLISGVADNGKTVRIRGQDWGYFLYLGKKVAFALFFIWLATGGLKEKEKQENASQPKEDDK